ncbi:diacylglycerol kinase [Novipirellula artificiosorum]|uniref:Prokaryotic diacylglycerol kinase n=1 Tax=Novipirellula artificiosorum TaxID=2528016 RepID=A0A5C6DEK2_9BACT|nr:diacylglycerol kinase [Novipirellula artificiosorum]TWU35098.1 Prokaryotic diacylglycerol kinase [Novipirellula artificiosorum]
MIAAGKTWRRKFAVAIRGLGISIREQPSFWVHLPVALCIIALAAWLHLEPWRWVAILISITVVLSAELMNTAIERLVSVLHPQRDPRIGDVLDTAAASVFIAAIGAVAVGCVVLIGPLIRMLSER